MGKQIITVGPDGSLFGLDHKQKGVQLRKLGHAKTERATLVVWDEGHQHWYIQWYSEEGGEGDLWTDAEELERYGFTMEEVNAVALKDPAEETEYLCNILFFEEYEDAVACEVKVIQHIQTTGGSSSLAA